MSEAAEQWGSGGDGRGRRRRRRWSEARKRQIVAESYQPGVSVSVVARRHDVNANLVFSWRRQYRKLVRVVGGFVPVVISSTEGAEPAKLPLAPPDTEPQPSGRICSRKPVLLANKHRRRDARSPYASGTGRAGSVARHRHGEWANDGIQTLVGEGSRLPILRARWARRMGPTL